MRRDSSEMLDNLPEDPQPDLELYFPFCPLRHQVAEFEGALYSNLHLNYILGVDLYPQACLKHPLYLFNH